MAPLSRARLARRPAGCYSPGMTRYADDSGAEHPERRSTKWPDSALDERFRSVAKDVEQIDHQVRAIGPLVGDVSGLKESTASLRRDIGRLEDAVKTYVNRSVTRQLVIVSTPLFFGSAGLVLALLSGKLG